MKKNKQKEYQKKAQRRQRQFDLCHTEEAMAKAHAKERQNSKRETYIACITQWETSSISGGVGMLSHYEFSISQLKDIMKWKPVNLSECHQEGSAKYSPNYATDYECVAIALQSFVQNPHADTMGAFLDADPTKTNEEIEAEWRMGIKTSGDLVECVNHAVASRARAAEAQDYSCFMGCPFIEIDLPREALKELKRTA